MTHLGTLAVCEASGKLLDVANYNDTTNVVLGEDMLPPTLPAKLDTLIVSKRYLKLHRRADLAQKWLGTKAASLPLRRLVLEGDLSPSLLQASLLVCSGPLEELVLLDVLLWDDCMISLAIAIANASAVKLCFPSGVSIAIERCTTLRENVGSPTLAYDEFGIASLWA